MKFFFNLFLVLMAIHQPVYADVGKAMEALANRDYETFYEEALKSAESGDSAGMSLVASAYLTGRGIERDPAQANLWFEKAAEAGDVNSQNNVALRILANPASTEDEKEKGLYWLEKAASNGHPDSALRLGMLYMTGSNVTKDTESGVKFLRTAAMASDEKYPNNKSVITAQYNLGVMLLTGYEGIEKDTTNAYVMLKLAAQNGHAKAIPIIEKWEDTAFKNSKQNPDN